MEKESFDRIDDTSEKRVDVLCNLLVACQEESTSYNNAFISSAIICSILTVAAGLSIKIPEDDDFEILVYLIPVVYLLVVFNLLKYTGFQISLGAYRQLLEEEINKLLGGDRLLLWETVILRSKSFILIDGAGQVFFFIPPLVLFMYLFILRMPESQDGLWLFFVISFMFELIICLIQIANLIRKASKEYDIFQKAKYKGAGVSNHDKMNNGNKKHRKRLRKKR